MTVTYITAEILLAEIPKWPRTVDPGQFSVYINKSGLGAYIHDKQCCLRM